MRVLRYLGKEIKMLYILQYRGLSPISNLIKAISWGAFSHSAIANSNTGWVCEAWEKGGVSHEPSPWSNHTEGTVISVYELSAKGREHHIWHEALQRIGQKYDYLSLMGFLPILRMFWKDDPNKYFCSHYVALCCRLGGARLFSQETPLYKISPSLLSWSPKLKWQCDISNDTEWEKFLEGVK